MTPHIPEEFSTRLIDWSPFVIMGNTIPPRDPDEDEEDEDEEDRCDEPPVVREPDEESKSPPAEPGALGIGPLEAAIRGADATLHALDT